MEAAQQLQMPGSPPTDALVAELSSCRREFTNLRDRVLTLGQSLEVDCPPVENLANLEDLTTLLNEIAEASRVGVEIDDARAPLRPAVRGFCEILGLDPLYLANEGKLVAVVPAAEAARALAALRAHPLGRDAVAIGEVHAEEEGRVVMRTLMGGMRVVDMLVGEQLPRIC